jgi:hypothetical protein
MYKIDIKTGFLKAEITLNSLKACKEYESGFIIMVSVCEILKDTTKTIK